MNDSAIDDLEEDFGALTSEVEGHLAAIGFGDFDGIAALCKAECRNRDDDLAEGSGLNSGFSENEQLRWEAWCRWWLGWKFFGLGNECAGVLENVPLSSAVKSYDEAIRLRASLPIDQSDRSRNDLAAAWMSRGIALELQNTTACLAEAVKSHDEAIRLRSSLPIDQSDQYRNDLAAAG